MYNYHNKKKLVWSVFLILLLAIGIGYAYLTSNLSIAGNTSVTTNTWNIHFENLNVTTGSVTATTAASINAAGDAITYTINLNRPKEFYEFIVDVKNDGTLPGKVSISELSGITTDAEPIIDYSIKYTNGKSVNIGDILNAGAKNTIKVRVFYKDEIDPEDFPNDDLNLTLSYTLQYVQSEEDGITTDTIVQSLIADNSSCLTKYEGNVTDSVGVTEEATKVYFNKCSDKRNIKFAGYCWQMIRTTENGGIKMIYNGEPDGEGECGSSRGDHLGIVRNSGVPQELGSEMLYGKSFVYDTNSKQFTLTDVESATWSNSTYENLIGKFTCKSISDTCSEIYGVNGYYTNTSSYTARYTISDTNYAQIGESYFNIYVWNPGAVGYMFNKSYMMKQESSLSGTIKFGSTFTYNDSTGRYTLSGTTQDITNISSQYNLLSNTHYTCWSSGDSCFNLSYVYNAVSNTAFYINVKDGKDIDDILDETLRGNNVNHYDSNIKGIIDAWYKHNLNGYTSMLEDTVYCNSRNITSLGGWKQDGGNMRDVLTFKNYDLTTDLSCTNVVDQFSLSNNLAKLTYPIALITNDEVRNIDNTSLMNTNKQWWTLSLYNISQITPYHRLINSSGNYTYDYSNAIGGVRPVITLKSGTVISDGTGSEASPWIVQ